MNRFKILPMLLGVGVIPVIGCSQAQLDPGVARSMVDLRRDLSSTRAQLSRTTSTLRDIAKNPRLNTSQQVGFYQEEMTKMEGVIEHLRDVHMQMETQSDKYFEAWAGEMGKLKDEQLASAAKSRKDASERAVKAVQAKLELVKQSGSPLMSGLRDLVRYFKNDTTAEGVEAAVPTIKKTLALEQDTINRLDEAITQIDEVTKSVQ